VSKRYFAPRPEPDWHWTERDQPDAIWTNYPAFFSQFDQAGEAAGFVMLADNEKNRRLMEVAAK
jgi:hypothetical protein